MEGDILIFAAQKTRQQIKTNKKSVDISQRR